MPPKKAAAAVKPATKMKATAKPITPSATATKKTPTVTATKPTTKRKAFEVEDEAAKPASKKPKTKAASAVPAKVPANARPGRSATTEKTAAPAKQEVALQKAVAPKKAPAVKKAVAEVDVEPAKKPPMKAAKKAVAPKKPAAPKKVAAPKMAAAPKPKKALPDINFVPTTKLQIYVFGEGSAGELGLGAANVDGKKVIDVKRPRLNHRLEAIGVVQIAVGGMHCAALSADNKIYTWGVNDQGALGRFTTKEGKMKDITASGEDSDSDSEDSGLNPSEAEPREVDSKYFAEDTKFAALYAGDSTTFAVTTTGLVYGWGSFRANEGVLGFSKDVKEQTTPILLPDLKDVKHMAIGTNHAMALTHKGRVFAWGAGEQSQLARRVVARTAIGALTPREFGLQRKKIVDIGTGDYHSFAIDKNGDVFGWGLNTFGQTGITKANEADDTVNVPTLVQNLKGKGVKQLAGGAHHTISCTNDGEVLVWGRVDNYEGGMKVSDMPKDSLYFDTHGNARYLTKPLTIPNIKGVHVSTGPDTCLVVTEDHKAYSWGFSTNYQTGLGVDEDVDEATLIDNTAIRGKKIIFGGVGGQFGVLGGDGDAEMTNGV